MDNISQIKGFTSRANSVQHRELSKMGHKSAGSKKLKKHHGITESEHITISTEYEVTDSLPRFSRNK